MRKKLLVVGLAVSMLAAMTACGKDKETSSKPVASGDSSEATISLFGDKTEEASASEATSASTAEATTEATTENKDASSETGSTEATTQAGDSGNTAEASGFDIGAVDGQKYVNKAFGFAAEFPDDWTLYDKERIAKENSITAEEVTNEKFLEKMKSFGQPKMFGADNSLSGKFNTVLMLSAERKAYFGNFDGPSKEFYEPQVAQFEQTYTNMGYTDVAVNIKDAKFIGQDVIAIDIDCTYAGQTMFQRIFTYGDGDYVLMIAVAGKDEAEVNDILGYFSAYQGQ